MRRRVRRGVLAPWVDREHLRRYAFVITLPCVRYFTSRRLMLSYAHRATLGTEE